MATVYNLVELSGNGTIRGLVLSTFDRKKAEKEKTELDVEGQHNRQYLVLSGDIQMPAKKKAEKKGK